MDINSVFQPWSAPKDAPAAFDVDPITISELLSELESLRS